VRYFQFPIGGKARDLLHSYLCTGGSGEVPEPTVQSGWEKTQSTTIAHTQKYPALLRRCYVIDTMHLLALKLVLKDCFMLYA
jgi:hypothetical protein